MPISETHLRSVEEYLTGRYKLEMDHDMFVLYDVADRRRITIRRHERKKGHYHNMEWTPRLSHLGEDILSEVNYLLAEQMLPYARPRRKSDRPQDTQKARLYRAESQVPGWGEDKIEELIDVQAYVNGIVQSSWWRKNYPDVTYIDVKDSTHRGSPAKRGRAYPTKRLIRLPPFARHPMYIIHEMAHVAEDPKGDQKTASHGPTFCRVYLDIVQFRLGHEKAALLQSRMEWNTVKYD